MSQTTGEEMLNRINETLGVLQDAQEKAVEAVRDVATHKADPDAHGEAIAAAVEAAVNEALGGTSGGGGNTGEDGEDGGAGLVDRLSALEGRFDKSGKVKAEHLPLTDALDSDTGKLAASDGAVKTLNDRLNGLLSSPAESSLWIGVPRPWRSTALPPSHCWANGDFVAFADWPELEEVYAAGGFEGMLMPWDADGETQAENLGQWRPDAAEPTGLYVPQLSKQFLRCFVGADGDQTAGTAHNDTMRPITGQVTSYGSQTPTSSGALSWEPTGTAVYAGKDASVGNIRLNSANIGATYSGTETAPVHVYQPYIIYLGKPAKEAA